MSQQTRPTEYPDTRSPEVRREVHVDAGQERSPRLELSVPKILAGALAAASAAVCASWLGVAGTVLGAVVASVVVSVTSALYSHPLERSTQVIREVMPQLPSPYRDDASADETRVLDASREAEGSETKPDAPSTTTITSTDSLTRRAISWKAIAVSSVLTLVVGLGMLTAVEALTGGAVGPSGGGTTLSRIVKGDGSQAGDTNQDKPATPGQSSGDPDSPAPTADEPTDGGATDEPTEPDPTEPDPTEPTPTEPTQTQPTGAAGAGGAASGDSLDSGDSGDSGAAADAKPLGATSSL